MRFFYCMSFISTGLISVSFRSSSTTRTFAFISSSGFTRSARQVRNTNHWTSTSNHRITQTTGTTSTTISTLTGSLPGSTKVRSSVRFMSRQTENDGNDSQQEGTHHHHLILVGGGHGHVQVIKALNEADRPDTLRVTLIDMHKSASYSGMVPGSVANNYTPEETQLHLEPLAKWAGIHFIHDKVVDIDFEGKRLYRQQSDEPLSFDVISIDIGSSSRGLDDTPGARKYAIATRPIHELVRKVEEAREQLAEAPRLVVIGGGAAGLELSMAITTRWKEDFPATQCTVLDAGSQLLPHESRRARALLSNVLKEKGIDVRHGCEVESIEEEVIRLKSGDNVPFSHCIWATGAGAHPLAKHLRKVRGLACTDRDWIRVNPYLQSVSHPFVFAAGDCVEIEGLERGSPPKAGVYAVRSGPVLIQNLSAFLEGKELTEYVPQDDFLKLLVCGDGKAMGFRFGLAFYGSWVFRMKDYIDQEFMKLFRVDGLPKPERKAKRGNYDTSQYDAGYCEKHHSKMNPEEAANLLQRTDDDVDHMKAWCVLRGMALDEDYRNAVLSFVDARELVES